MSAMSTTLSVSDKTNTNVSDSWSPVRGAIPSAPRMPAIRNWVGKLEHRRTSRIARTRCCHGELVGGGTSSTGERPRISGLASSATVSVYGRQRNRVKMTVVEFGIITRQQECPQHPANESSSLRTNPAPRVGLTELVRTWGFTADSAGDGEEALQRITVFRPSIIISDLVMPRRDGLELLRALKDDGSDYTVVILTAQGTVETAVEAMKEAPTTT